MVSGGVVEIAHDLALIVDPVGVGASDARNVQGDERVTRGRGCRRGGAQGQATRAGRGGDGGGETISAGEELSAATKGSARRAGAMSGN